MPMLGKSEMDKDDRLKVKSYLRGLILLIDRTKEVTITQSSGLDRVPGRHGIAGFEWDNSVMVNIQLYGIRPRAKRGRKKTTGRYKTREELERTVMTLYLDSKQSLSAIADLCGISFTTAANIFKDNCLDATIERWGAGTE